MTNGEKIQTILDVDRDCTEVHGENGTMAFTVTQDWWNAKYIEPLTKVNQDLTKVNQDLTKNKSENPISSDIRLNQDKNELNRVKNELESTTKNDLAVDCVSRNDVERIIERDYGSCWNENDYYDRLLADLEELPSVTSQEPILDKIRAEIIERKHLYQLNEVSIDHSGATGEQALKWVLETIDKLLSEQAESKDKE